MSHPPIPEGSPRFRNRSQTATQPHYDSCDQFLCGDNVWRLIADLKAYDAEHGTHYADDCANAARAAFFNTFAHHNEAAESAADSLAAHVEYDEADDAMRQHDAWAAWLKGE